MNETTDMNETCEISLKIWKFLICAAHERKTYNYVGLSRTLRIKGGAKGPSGMMKYLAPILHYCEQRGYPPLTDLVVKKATGLPVDELKTKDKDMNKQREQVFHKDWLALQTPTASNFQNAIKPQT
ncbi:MAG: hypothetical protein OD918_04315 [Gammaproteobacteria bacterium]